MMIVDEGWIRRRPESEWAKVWERWPLGPSIMPIMNTDATPTPMVMVDPALEGQFAPASPEKKWSLADDWMNFPR